MTSLRRCQVLTDMHEVRYMAVQAEAGSWVCGSVGRERMPAGCVGGWVGVHVRGRLRGWSDRQVGSQIGGLAGGRVVMRARVQVAVSAGAPASRCTWLRAMVLRGWKGDHLPDNLAPRIFAEFSTFTFQNCSKHLSPAKSAEP